VISPDAATEPTTIEVPQPCEKPLDADRCLKSPEKIVWSSLGEAGVLLLHMLRETDQKSTFMRNAVAQYGLATARASVDVYGLVLMQATSST